MEALVRVHVRDAAVVAALSIFIAQVLSLLQLNSATVSSARSNPVVGLRAAANSLREQPMGSASSKLAAKMAGRGGASSEQMDTFIDSLLADHPVVVFSKSFCPYCHLAKAAIKDAGAAVPAFAGPEVLELDRRPDGSAIQRALAARTGRTTVPNVFVAGKPIGGGDETSALQRAGKLADLIRAAVSESQATKSTASAATTTTAASVLAVPLTPESDFGAYIDALVKGNDVVLFGKTFCPYCKAAKTAIAESGAKVAGFAGATVIELDEHEFGAEIQAKLVEKTGRSTVPNVFVGGVNVGGGDDTVELHESGVLAQMIRSAPQKRAAAESESGTSETQATTSDVQSGEKLITFGAGCFWGVELAFQRQEGVLRSEVGFSNGKFSPVSYDAVCTGRSGHAEVVRVWYDPAEVDLSTLIALWEDRHDVTSLNKQGNDRGTQYRSALFWSDDAGKDAATAWHSSKLAAGVKVVTDVAEEAGYSAAEPYHQKYLERGGQDASKGSTKRIRCYG